MLQVLYIINHEPEFRNIMKPVYDYKKKEIYFYTSGSSSFLPKSEIENCSSVSVFDEIRNEGKR